VKQTTIFLQVPASAKNVLSSNKTTNFPISNKTIFREPEGKKHLQRVLEALIQAYGKPAVIKALQKVD